MNQNITDFDSLIEYLPETCLEFLEQNEIKSSSLMDFLSPQKIWQAFEQEIKTQFSAQLEPIIQILTLCLLCAVFCALVSDSSMMQINTAVSFTSAVVCIATVITPTCQIIETASETLQNGCVFFGTFAPAYTAAAAAAGRPVAASFYSTMSAILIQLLSLLCAKGIKPILICFLCLSIASCLCGEISLTDVLASCKKMIMWLISAAVILFNGILSVQAFVSKPTDTLALKTGKTIVSTLIPVVGSAVSDAFSTIYGGIAVVQNAIGVYGIASVCLLFLPVLIHCLFVRMSVWLCNVICGLFHVTPAQKCMQGCGEVLDIVLALVAGFLCLFVISCMLLSGG